MRLLLLNYGKYIGELVVTIDLAPTTIFTFHLVNLPETLVLHLIVNPAVHGIITLGFPKPIQLRQMDPKGTNWVCLKIYRNPVVYLFSPLKKSHIFSHFWRSSIWDRPHFPWFSSCPRRCDVLWSRMARKPLPDHYGVLEIREATKMPVTLGRQRPKMALELGGKKAEG